MRKQLCEALIKRAVKPELIFLTGDLGFMALERLQQAMGPRFINAGVAEQNMVTVAAALAYQKFEVWIYSIAPFIYARPFEQIRNDITFHKLPVKLIGNGGGYGYGVMGPTHHAIDDYGALLTLPNMTVYVPVFDEDIDDVIARAGTSKSAAYIRIGRGEAPQGFKPPIYAPWRQLTHGDGPVVLAVGPLAGIYLEPFENLPDVLRPNLWAVAELSLQSQSIPEVVLDQIKKVSSLCIAEEHVRHGSFGSDFMLCLADQGISVRRFSHFYARAHHYERYGSQHFLRRLSGLDSDSVLAAIETLHYD